VPTIEIVSVGELTTAAAGPAEAAPGAAGSRCAPVHAGTSANRKRAAVERRITALKISFADAALDPRASRADGGDHRPKALTKEISFTLLKPPSLTFMCAR